MKYFLCVFDTVYLGIPSEFVERVISVSANGLSGSGMQSSVCEIHGNDVYISLPLLFGRADLPSPHGLVLKSGESSSPVNGERKTILLTPPLDIDLEIPEEDVYSVPRAFSELLRYCNGSCFINIDRKEVDRQERLVFTLDINKLLEIARV